MEEQIEEFNSMLINLYFKNLEFLKTNHKKVFDKVNKLSDEINNGKYKEKYSLEYKPEGYFDVLDLETNEFIFGFDSYLEADKRAESVDFTRHHSLDLLRTDPSTNKFALMGSLGGVGPLVNYLNSQVDFEKITFSKIFKFIFIGVGVGVHMHEIYKKIDSMNTLIIEPNLELFRLSLFTIDYSIFEENNKKLFLSVDENLQERELTRHHFTEYHAYMNYNIKHHLFWINYEYLLNETIDFYSHTHAAAFSYNSVLEVFTRTVDFMYKEYRFLKKDLVHSDKPLADKKVLIVSAGPSVDNHIDWIYENQDKFIILCVDVIVKKLEKHKIIPDIIVSIDPSYEVAPFFKMEDDKTLKDAAIICLSQQEESVIETIKDFNFYFSQVFYLSKKLGYSMSLPNVGTFSFAMALFLDANELYLIGNDAAFDQETGRRYAKDSSYAIADDKIEENDDKNKGLVSNDDVIEVKGNLTDTVKTNRTLITFKRDYESFIHSFGEEEFKKIKAYNLSDGAYIEGLIPLNIDDIDIDSFEQKNFNGKETLDAITINDIDDVDFKEDIKTLTKIIGRVNKFKKIKVTSKDNFLEKKLDLMIWILEQNKTMDTAIFGNIFLKYIELADIYINFTLNLKQNNFNDSKKLMSIKNYWCDSLVDLLKKLKKAVIK